MTRRPVWFSPYRCLIGSNVWMTMATPGLTPPISFTASGTSIPPQLTVIITVWRLGKIHTMDPGMNDVKTDGHSLMG